MARVERLLAAHPQGAAVKLDPFLQDITDEILAASTPRDRTTLSHSHPKDGAVAGRQARSVGLIVGELVTNAINFAHPAGVWGRVGVSSRPGAAQGSQCIQVQDDGVGLPENFDPHVDGGAGLSAVRSLAERLGAKLDFTDRGIGLSVRLDVPAPDQPPIREAAK